VKVWVGLFWIKVGSHDQRNERLGFRKGKELPHQLSDCQILKKDSFP
jgi:hypothetical protein